MSDVSEREEVAGAGNFLLLARLCGDVEATLRLQGATPVDVEWGDYTHSGSFATSSLLFHVFAYTDAVELDLTFDVLTGYWLPFKAALGAKPTVMVSVHAFDRDGWAEELRRFAAAILAAHDGVFDFWRSAVRGAFDRRTLRTSADVREREDEAFAHLR